MFKRPLLESPCSSSTSTPRLAERKELDGLREQLYAKEHELGEALKVVERMERERRLENGKEVLELKERIRYQE